MWIPFSLPPSLSFPPFSLTFSLSFSCGGGPPGGAQSLLPALCWGFIPGSLKGPYGMLGIQPGWLHARTESYLLYSLSDPIHLKEIFASDLSKTQMWPNPSQLNHFQCFSLEIVSLYLYPKWLFLALTDYSSLSVGERVIELHFLTIFSIINLTTELSALLY